MPAYQASMAYECAKLTVGEDVIIKASTTKSDDLIKIDRSLYLISKVKNGWKVFYCEPGKKAAIINIQNISGLRRC